MAIIHTFLVALCSVAAVLTAGNVQAQTIPPEGPVSVTFTATLIPPLRCVLGEAFFRADCAAQRQEAGDPARRWRSHPKASEIPSTMPRSGRRQCIA